jgi:uncharacterized membrane protein
MQRKAVDPRSLAVTAIMAAIVFVLTRMVQVPTPAKGYIHLGDAGVFFSAFAFGPWIGAMAGGLGTGLADVTSGYPQWAIFSLLIHGAQGWVVGWASERWRSVMGLVLSTVVGGVIVVAGYLVAGMILAGVGAALGELPLNVIQVAGGAVVGVPLFAAVRQAYPPILRLGRQRQ